MTIRSIERWRKMVPMAGGSGQSVAGAVLH